MKRFLLSIVAAWTVALAALVAHAGPRDGAAEQSLKDAVETDYLEMHFDAAEKKLRKAVAACGTAGGCSPAVRAKVLVGLGAVLAAGKKQLTDAKDVFVEALNVDPAAQLPADLASPEATYAFDLAKKEAKVAPKPAPVAPVAEPAPLTKSGTGVEGDLCDESTPCRDDFVCRFGTCKTPGAEGSKPDEPASKAARRSWITVLYSPDVTLVSGTNVCTAASRATDRYVCLRQNHTNYAGTPTVNEADDINTGLAAGTMRVTLGYERIVLDNLGLGVKVGFQFNGIASGPTPVLPVYAEGRVSYYVGKKPFESLGVRPSVFLAAGVSEVNGNSDVQVLEDGTACGAANPSDHHSACTHPSSSADDQVEPRIQDLQAYRRYGPGFAGGGIAIAVAPAEGVAFNLGARVGVTFPTPALVIAPEGGFSLGF